jgi:hypothetical protein
MSRSLILLLAAIGIAHLGYFAFPAALQPRAFYIMRGIEGMALFGLLAHFGPRAALWAGACLWGYAEEWQSAVCRIATFSDPAPGGSMLCVGLLGVKPYAALLAASLAFLALRGIKAWPAR